MFQIFVEILVLAAYHNFFSYLLNLYDIFPPYSTLAAFECLKVVSKKGDFLPVR